MLSVIITSYDKPVITAAHVRECMNASVVPDEIIVVNDGGDDSIKELLKKLDKKTKIIYAKIRDDIPWNYHGACNLGVWLSRGDYLGFEDTDNIPTVDYYKNALEVIKSREDIGRVYSYQRWEINASDLEKPVDEWTVIGKRGPNQGSYIIERDVYLKLKGQDEKFCGRYGWMYYDWKRRLLGKAKINFAQAGYFWYVVDGQCNLEHKNHPTNAAYLRMNTRHPHLHDKTGILNFEFEYEYL